MVCGDCKRDAHGECLSHTLGYTHCTCQHESREGSDG